MGGVVVFLGELVEKFGQVCLGEVELLGDFGVANRAVVVC